MRIKTISIKPTEEIFTSFKRLPYTFQSAICEFIDNSIASFEVNKNRKIGSINHSGLEINVVYETGGVFDNEHKLIISDNAFGMNFEEAERAMKLQSIPKSQMSLNQYGLGLKYAPGWFGECWKLESANFEKRKIISIKFEESKILEERGEIKIYEDDIKSSNSGTKIEITKLRRKLDFEDHKESKDIYVHIKDVYSKILSDHGEDIKIRICFKKDNGYYNFSDGIEKNRVEKISSIEPIKPKTKKIYYDSQNKRHLEWSIDSYIVDSEANKFAFKGKMFINESILNKSGFYFYRKKRLIEIWDAKTQFFGNFNPRRRIFAELELSDNWIPSQAKDKIIWEGDLKVRFINWMKNFEKKHKIFYISNKIGRTSNVEPNDKLINEKKAIDLTKKKLKTKIKKSFETVETSFELYDNKTEKMIKIICLNKTNSELIKFLINFKNEQDINDRKFDLKFIDEENKYIINIFLKNTFFNLHFKTIKSKDIALISDIFLCFVRSVIESNVEQEKKENMIKAFNSAL